MPAGALLSGLSRIHLRVKV